MKSQNNHLILQLILVATFCFLFYSMNPGINMFLFQLALIGIAFIGFPRLLNTTKGRAITVLNLVSGLAVMLYGNALSVFMVIASGMMLSAYLSFSYSTAFFTSFMGPVNLITSPFRLLYHSLKNMGGSKKTGSRVIAVYVLIPAVVLLIFTILYSSMSAGFRHFIITDLLKAIDVPRIIMVLIPASIWVFFLFHYYTPAKPKKLQVVMKDESTTRLRGSLQGVDRPTEYSMGIYLISLLLVLLVTVLISDVYYSSSQNSITAYQLEAGIDRSYSHSSGTSTFSDDLHEATSSLILSIILSALIVQWFLRTKDDGSPKFNRLKWISAIWVGMNIILIVYTFSKDLVYIRHLGFSYLRIGVLVFLVLATIGCILTLIRIFQNKNLWYLARNMATAVLVTGVFSSIVPWDGIITRANIQIGEKQKTSVDLSYIYSLRHPDYIAIDHYTSKHELDKLYPIKRNYSLRHESPVHQFLGSNIMSMVEQHQYEVYFKQDHHEN